MPVLLAVLLPGAGRAQQAPAAPPQAARSLEIARTAQALVGRWTGSMTATTPQRTETFPWSIECRPVALGGGAACTMEGTASIGPLAQSCLLAYDPEGKAVHLMCVTSMGEVHDHKGRWTDDRTLAFEPLRGGMADQVVTETLAWWFPESTRVVMRSTVEMDGGASMSFEFSGWRN
jgi:hypothetical protein